MMTSFARQLVADFWERVGYEEAFPRRLEQPIMSNTPVFIVKVHHQRLDPAYIENRLRRRGIRLPTRCEIAPNTMRGCLVAFKGEAAIFLNGTLSPEETRVIIAHEFGHYLGDYEWPRMRAVRHFGDGILNVLDGVRPATTQERLGAALADVQVGAYVHYMDRSLDSEISTLVDVVEDTAHIIGAELLAPWKEVVKEVHSGGHGFDRAGIMGILRQRFGLPEPYANWYAGRLESEIQRERSFCDILGL